MNLRNESKSSTEMSIEDLVKMNGEAMTVLDEVPYQPILYAIPKEWVESGMNLLKNAVQFQPTLYKKITPLATQKEVQNQQIQMKVDLGMAKEEVLNSIKDLKKQDGSLKEKFFSELSAQHSAAVKAVQDEYGRQKKESLRFLLITAASSAALSGLVSGLCLLLGG